MNRAVYIEDRGSRRPFAEHDFPLLLGGAGATVPLPGIDERPAAHLGLAEGRVFVQAGGSEPVFCNGARLSASQWLEQGDVLRIGDTRIAVRVEADRFELIVERPEPVETPAPLLTPPPAPPRTHDSTEPRGRRIVPVEFRTAHAAGDGRRGRRAFYIAAALLIPLLLSIGLIWNLTRRPPEPTAVESTDTGLPENPAVAPPEATAPPTPEPEPVETPANRLPQLPPVPPRREAGRLELVSEPGGAAVTIDGEFRGETPIVLELPPDTTHRLQLSRAGYEPLEQEISLDAEEERRLTLELKARTGDVEIRAEPPGATVWVDGQLRGPAHATLSLVAMPHEIEIRKEGYESYKRTVTPRPGLLQSIDVELKTAQQLREEARVPLIRTSLGGELVLIEGGRFEMGAPRREAGRRSNETLREVEITRPFYLAAREVSNKDYRKFDEKHRSGAVNGYSLERDDHPVVKISWDLAAQFCNWLSEQDGLKPAYVRQGGKLALVQPPTTGYRLPTEAEWVWAARYEGGGEPRKYPWGNTLPVAPGSGNYGDESADGAVRTTLDGYNDDYVTTAPTDSFAPNRLGLFNTGGNVAEWVHDYYTVYPPGAGLQTDPSGPDDGDSYVIRGSSWMDSRVSELRLTYRDYGSGGRPDVGFRIARWAE